MDRLHGEKRGKQAYMDEKTIIIIEREGKYQLQNNGIPEFALIGMLECVVFDLKTNGHRGLPTEQSGAVAADSPPVAEPSKTSEPETSGKDARESNAPDLRTRIGKAVKAIEALGGKAENYDRSTATDDELQTELEELTSQYKRLKSSK